MTPASWSGGLPFWAWQVVLHASVLGAVFFVWARWLDLPSGDAKRRLLVVLLVVPLVTAAVPGRSDLAFRGVWAWFDSGRVLSIPLVAGLRLSHVALVVLIVSVVVTAAQEVLPVLRRARPASMAPPDWLVGRARELKGWSRCEVQLTPASGIVVATGGRPGRPRLVVSDGALSRLDPADLDLVVRHEHAHWRGSRWLTSHALFVVRLAQAFNPVALWAFREYCLEMELVCDRDALGGGDPKRLARVLLTVYEGTDRRDMAARSALRKRVEELLAPPPGADPLPLPAIGLATAVLLTVLPWLV